MLGKTAFLPEVEVLLTEESHCNSTRHTQRYPQRLEETYSQELVASWLNSLHGPGLSFSSSLNVVSQAQLKHGRQELTAARDDKPNVGTVLQSGSEPWPASKTLTKPLLALKT